MTRYWWGALAIAGTVFVALSAQAAEQHHKGRFVNLQPNELHCKKPSDVDGHVICTFEIPGVTINPDGSFGARVSLGTLDYVHGEGTAEGYSTTTQADGSTITTKWSGVSKVDDREVRNLRGSYHCVAGTGRFAGITCEGTYVSTYEAGGFVTGAYEGTMTLPE